MHKYERIELKLLQTLQTYLLLGNHYMIMQNILGIKSYKMQTVLAVYYLKHI